MIFAFLALTLRYRFDFAPFMTLAAFVGYRSFSIAAAESSKKCQKRLFAAAVGLCFAGILFSHYVLVLHKAWSMGVPMDVRLSLRPFLPSTYLPVPGAPSSEDNESGNPVDAPIPGNRPVIPIVV